jgi:hypothetical protein
VPWDAIDEIEMIERKGSDQVSHPAKLKMTDGKILEANVVINGAYPLVGGNTTSGGPIEPGYPQALVQWNCTILIGHIKGIKRVRDTAK